MLNKLHFIRVGYTHSPERVEILIWLGKKERFMGERGLKQENKCVPILIKLDGEETFIE